MMTAQATAVGRGGSACKVVASHGHLQEEATSCPLAVDDGGRTGSDRRCTEAAPTRRGGGRVCRGDAVGKLGFLFRKNNFTLRK
ncbi:hypothetical protein GW17_00013177 [Ensete ventricosum]|nr:hypothetical protein GW17_00013177 [Ensete ventricosum]